MGKRNLFVMNLFIYTERNIVKGDFKEIDREKCLDSEMSRSVDVSEISL